MKVFFTLLVFFSAAVLAGTDPVFSKAEDPAVRARENFITFLSENDDNNKAELLIAACELVPQSSLYSHYLSRLDADRPIQVKLGKRLLELARKHPENLHFVLMGMAWNRFAGMSRQEILEHLDLFMDHVQADSPEANLLFEHYLTALRSEGDFSKLAELAAVEKQELLIPIARFAFIANYFEPEKWNGFWRQILQNLRKHENKNAPRFMSELENFYFHAGMYSDAHRVRRMITPLKNGMIPPDELNVELLLLIMQKKYDAAHKLVASLDYLKPEVRKSLTSLILENQNPPPQTAISPEEIQKEYLPMLEDDDPENRLTAGMQLLFAVQETGDIPLFRKIRKTLMEQEENLTASQLNALGYIGIDIGDDIAANRKLVEKALLLEPRFFAYLDSLAWGYFKENKLELAAKTIRRALYAVPPSQDELNTLGVIFMHAGDIEAARGNPEKALQFYRKAQTCTRDPELDMDELQEKIRKTEESVK